MHFHTPRKIRVGKSRIQGSGHTLSGIKVIGEIKISDLSNQKARGPRSSQWLQYCSVANVYSRDDAKTTKCDVNNQTTEPLSLLGELTNVDPLLAT